MDDIKNSNMLIVWSNLMGFAIAWFSFGFYILKHNLI